MVANHIAQERFQILIETSHIFNAHKEFMTATEQVFSNNRALYLQILPPILLSLRSMTRVLISRHREVSTVEQHYEYVLEVNEFLMKAGATPNLPRHFLSTPAGAVNLSDGPLPSGQEVIMEHMSNTNAPTVQSQGFPNLSFR